MISTFDYIFSNSEENKVESEMDKAESKVGSVKNNVSSTSVGLSPEPHRETSSGLEVKEMKVSLPQKKSHVPNASLFHSSTMRILVQRRIGYQCDFTASVNPLLSVRSKPLNTRSVSSRVRSSSCMFLGASEKKSGSTTSTPNLTKMWLRHASEIDSIERRHVFSSEAKSPFNKAGWS